MLQKILLRIFQYKRNSPSRFSYEFIDLSPILSMVSREADTMKSFFNNHGGKYVLTDYRNKTEGEQVG